MSKCPQIAAGASGNSFAAGSTVYMAPGGCTRILTKTTESHCEDRIRTAVTSSGLRGYVLSNALSAGQTLVIKSRKNGADGGQTLTINDGVTGYVEISSGSDSLAAADLFALEAVTGTGGAVVLSSLTHDYEPTSGCITRWSTRSLTGNFANNTRYGCADVELGNAGTATEADWQAKMPSAFTAKHLRAYIATNSKSSTTNIRTRLGGANQAAVTYTGGTTGEQEDTSTSTTLADGDLFNFSIQTGSGTQAFNNFSGAAVQCSLEHSTDILLSGAGFSGALYNVNAATTLYFTPAGIGQASSTEADCKVRIKEGFTAKKLRVLVSTNSLDAGSTTITLRKNGVDTALVVTVASGAGTGYFENNSDTVTVAADDDLSIEITCGGTTGAFAARVVLFAGDFSSATNGQVTETASARIAVQSKVSESASARIAVQSEAVETGSVRISVASEVVETASARVSIASEVVETGSARLSVASEVTEVASAQIAIAALSGQVTETASARVVVYGEAFETAGARISIASEVVETGSARLSVAGEISKAASAQIATAALLGEVSETASARISVASEAIESASARISLASEVVELASVRLGVQGKVTEAASFRASLPGQHTETASARFSLASTRTTSSSVQIVLTAIQYEYRFLESSGPRYVVDDESGPRYRFLDGRVA